jgi:hypothetical protein
MKKAIVSLGVFVLIIGVLLTALPFVYIPKTTSEAYQVPQSTVLDSGPFPHFTNKPTNAVTEGLSLNAGDSLNIQVNVTSGIKMNLSINNGSATLLSYYDFTTLNVNWTVPQSLNFNFVFSSSSTFTYNDDNWQVTKNFTQTDYKEVSQNVQLLPFEVSYIGLVLALAGIGLTIYGVVKREAPKNVSPT